MFHVSDGESSEGGVFGELFDAHFFGGLHDGETSISGFDEFGEIFEGFTGSSVNFLGDFLEFDGDVGGMAIEDGGVSRLDLTGMVEDDDLGKELFAGSGGVIFGVGCNVTSFDFFDGDIFDVETDVVSGDGFSELFVMHFDGFDGGLFVRGTEPAFHIGLKDSGFDSSDGDCSDTSDLVDILKGKSEGFFSGSGGSDDFVEGL